MKVITRSLGFSTSGDADLVNITASVRSLLEESGLAAGSAPAALGSITLDDKGGLLFEAIPGVIVTRDGQIVTRTLLDSDDGRAPTMLKAGRLTFYVIKRQGRYALRLKDNDSLVRRQFHGIDSFPIDLRFRVEARFEPYDPPRTLAFQTAIGGSDAAISPGRVAFDLEGQNLSLEATREPGEDALSFVFGDLTNSNETYGGGRFLDASLADGGKVILDFNKAYNPPCVFTPYATCPLPTHENKLPVRIEAGERSSAMH